MLFQPQESIYLYPARLVVPPAGPLRIMDQNHRLYGPAEVAFIIPVDEGQGRKLKSAGFNTQASR
jgi:hypothetical protein